MDWAEKEATVLVEMSLAEYGATTLEIAAALRKAKANGMREAASWIERVKPDRESHTYMESQAVLASCAVAAGLFRSRADAIEKGTE